MNKILGIIIVIVVLVGGAYLLMNSAPDNTGSNLSEQNQKMDAQGRIIFSVTDAAAEMSTISEINMKVSRVDVHSSASGWMTVSTTPRTYKLLELNAESKSELLADVNANAGTYDQVRLSVDSISIETKAGATKEAKMPSGELKINTTLVVKSNTTSSVNFDFLADKSLHTTGNGEYIFAPVVKTESKSEANVSVSAENVVSIGSGKVNDLSTVGMDIDGSVKVDFQLNSKAKINLDNNDVIKIEGLLN